MTAERRAAALKAWATRRRNAVLTRRMRGRCLDCGTASDALLCSGCADARRWSRDQCEPAEGRASYGLGGEVVNILTSKRYREGR